MHTMKLKILLAVDGSVMSHRAAEVLINQAGKCAEPPEVHVITVHLPIPIDAATRHVDASSVEQYYRDESQKIIAPIEARLSQAGLAVTPHIHVGAPADIICRSAERLGVDLIIAGTHGHGALAGALLGSVSAKILKRASMPVLLVRPA